jgi:hypothetical protein
VASTIGPYREYLRVTERQVAQMQVGRYLGALEDAERGLAEALEMVSRRHEGDADVRDTAVHLADWSRRHAASLGPWVDRFGRAESPDPARLRGALFQDARLGGLGRLRDLQDLMLLVGQVHTLWTILDQAAQALHDRSMHDWCAGCLAETGRQRAWLETQIKNGAPQALIVAPARASELRASLPQTAAGAAAMAWRPRLLPRAVGYATAAAAGLLAGVLLRRRA